MPVLSWPSFISVRMLSASLLFQLFARPPQHHCFHPSLSPVSVLSFPPFPSDAYACASVKHQGPSLCPQEKQTQAALPGKDPLISLMALTRWSPVRHPHGLGGGCQQHRRYVGATPNPSNRWQSCMSRTGETTLGAVASGAWTSSGSPVYLCSSLCTIGVGLLTLLR